MRADGWALASLNGPPNIVYMLYIRIGASSMDVLPCASGTRLSPSSTAWRAGRRPGIGVPRDMSSAAARDHDVSLDFRVRRCFAPSCELGAGNEAQRTPPKRVSHAQANHKPLLRLAGPSPAGGFWRLTACGLARAPSPIADGALGPGGQSLLLVPHGKKLEGEITRYMRDQQATVSTRLSSPWRTNKQNSP